MKTSFKDNNSTELIILFDGWGMDEKPYQVIKSHCDILFVHDYCDLDFYFDSSSYQKIYLITFSAGVFMAGFLKDKLPKFDYKVAINGVLNPFNELSGIPQSSFHEMECLTLENAMEFRKKLILDEAHLSTFNACQPHRTLQNSLDELSALKKCFINPIELEYDKIIIGENDLIIPAQNQLVAWNNHPNINLISGGHFLFYNFESFDELIG